MTTTDRHTSKALAAKSATKPVVLREATLADIAAIERLLNQCYRQTQGWTHEADLVGGIRTTPAELAKVIADPKQHLLLYCQINDSATCSVDIPQRTGALCGCIAVGIKSVHDERASKPINKAYIGMFAVHPSYQGQGIGHQILTEAEKFAIDRLADQHPPRHLTMSILSHRPELLAYYERRGYRLTGNTSPFPMDGNNGVPKRDDLRLLELEKLVNASPAVLSSS